MSSSPFDPSDLETLSTTGSLFADFMLFSQLATASISPSSPRPVHRRSSSGQTDTTAPRASGSEHWRISQHIGDDEEADVAASNVDLVKMRHSAVAGCGGNVFELNVHVVFGFQ